MNIVVKIPDKDYSVILTKIMLACHGCKIIELPKGYGRLIDADALKKDDELTEWLSLNAVRTGKMLKSFSELFIKKIDAADTILEADKEGNVEYEAKAITRGRCMICGKELDEGLFFCKECERKAEREDK